jgi:hypothetical protein
MPLLALLRACSKELRRPYTVGTQQDMQLTKSGLIAKRAG